MARRYPAALDKLAHGVNAPELCLDTSFFIGARLRVYPPDVFGLLWQRLDQAATERRIVTPDEVLKDLKKKDDDVHKWLKERTHIVLAPSDAIVIAAMRILELHPTLRDNKPDASESDAYAIALAQALAIPVVTEELAKPKRPRIPDVCQKLGAESLTPAAGLRLLGFTNL